MFPPLPHREILPEDKNKIETSDVSAEKTEPARCSYIAACTWQTGAPPFCGEPVLPGSSYCRRHAPLCRVDPASREGAQIAAEQESAAIAAPALSEPWPHLAPCAVPDPLEEEDMLEAWDLPFTTTSDGEEA